MKKVFPAIVVLIALSLLGIIILQISWLTNLLKVQEQTFLDRIDRAGINVTQELSKQASSGILMHLHQPDLEFMLNDPSLNTFRPPTLSQRYTTTEIYTRLRNAFQGESLPRTLDFEFAVTANSNDAVIEMQSRDFITEYLDTLHNKRIIIPVIPQSGSDVEGLVPYENMVIIIPDFKTQVWQSLIWMVAGSSLFTLIVIAAFYLTVKTLLNQRKLSKIKSDFINNMTHEFKTPLATISLAVDALKNDKVQNDPEKRQYFSGIIKEENKRMNRHVETILQAALMDRQELKLKLKPVHIHEIIRQIVGNFTLQMNDKQGKFQVLLNAKNDMIDADEVHFANLINNLIDNAIKYSKENLVIKITTHSTNKLLVMQIDDTGIGMSKETVKRIFEKFYRAHTGNLHDVKGFGLGMSYVKTVVDAHKGKIKVESTLGKGSSFTVEMPLSANISE